jgi:hypothetical protein
MTVYCNQNLLLIVGHANLLSSLFTRLAYLEDKTQRFDKDSTTLKTKADGWDTNPKPVLAIGKRITPLNRPCCYINADLTCTKII